MNLLQGSEAWERERESMLLETNKYILHHQTLVEPWNKGWEIKAMCGWGSESARVWNFVFAFPYACLHLCVCVNPYVFLFVYVCAYVYVCMCVCVSTIVKLDSSPSGNVFVCRKGNNVRFDKCELRFEPRCVARIFANTWQKKEK